MVKRLEFEILPERGISNDAIEFTLGMPFQYAVTSLRKQHLTVKEVQVVYNEADPLTNDLILNLPHDGLRLYFDSRSQTLKVIEISDLSALNLKYCGSMISNNGNVPSLDKIDHCFGATHPGVYDPDEGVFELKFRGLQFQFPADPRLIADQKSAAGVGAAISFSPPPLVSKMHIYSGNSLQESVVPPMPLQYFYGNVFAESVEAIFSEIDKTLKSLKFTLMKEELSTSGLRNSEKIRKVERVLSLGDSCQKIMSTFGAPNKTFYKQNDKMKIHTPYGLQSTEEEASHYFLNYFTLGCDLLIHGTKHTLMKIILHTNYPCHYHFNIYHRCPFSIDIPQCFQPEPNDVFANTRTSTITPFTKWDSISENVKINDKPVVLTRASCENNTNPFGPTFCFNFTNLIFEVMQNGYVASVTIFE